jgi:TRAP-type C4-dicarboxylate transport system permease small subunit
VDRALAGLDRLERGLGFVEDTAAMALLTAMAFIVNLQIVARYVFAAPMMWPEEVTRLTLVWLTFIGAAALSRRTGDIAVTTFVEMLPPGGQRLAAAARDVVLVVLFALVMREGGRLAEAVAGMPLVATEWPTALLAWPVAIGAFLMILHPVLRLVRFAAGAQAPQP